MTGADETRTNMASDFRDLSQIKFGIKTLKLQTKLLYDFKPFFYLWFKLSSFF